MSTRILAAVAVCLYVLHPATAAAAICALPGLDVGNADTRPPPASGPVTVRFGMQPNPLLGRPGQHDGQDYKNAIGEEVRAIEGGFVMFAGTDGGRGKTISIAHGDGFETRYTNLSRFVVAQGACVEKGAVVGFVGCTGLCTEPHLHFEVRRHGTPVDPALFVGSAKMAPEEPGPDPIALWSQVDPKLLLDKVVAATEAHFLDKELLRRIDFKGRAQRTRAALADARSKADAVGLINALLASLETSHTALLTPDQVEFYILTDLIRPRTEFFDDPRLLRLADRNEVMLPSLGLFTREIDGRHFVDGLLEGMAAEKAGLRFGDEIVSVDGAPYSPVASLRGKVGRQAMVELRRKAGGSLDRIGLPVTPIRPSQALPAATKASARVIAHNGRRIGYIRVWSFNDARAFESALRSLYPDTPAAPAGPELLIVDLRGKVGGSASVAGSILSMLDVPFQDRYSGRWRQSNQASWHSSAGETRKDRRSSEPAVPYPPTFRGRTALLIDHHTRSSGEIMAHGYKRSGFGPVIGTPTAGAVVGGGTFWMPGGLVLYMGLVGHTFDGWPLEGVGVHPDIRIEQPLAYANGADPVLDMALEVLGRRD